MHKDYLEHYAGCARKTRKGGRGREQGEEKERIEGRTKKRREGLRIEGRREVKREGAVRNGTGWNETETKGREGKEET